MKRKPQTPRAAEGREMQAKAELAKSDTPTPQSPKTEIGEGGSHPLWALDDAALDDVPDEVKGARR